MSAELLTQLTIMLDLQDKMNAKVNPDWRSQGNEWYRAIWIESAELLDHHGWKWWKKQSPDVEQVQLELIDIWHFGLSILLEQNEDKEQLAEQLQLQLESGLESSQCGVDFKLDLEQFALQTLQTRGFDINGFLVLLKGMNMSLSSLYRGYVGKNVLNFFRQDHGYKEGSYIKVWQGKEDNEHLVEAVQALDVSSVNFADELYQALKQRYSTAV